MDILKAMEQAKILSGLMNSDNEAKSGGDGQINNMENMLQMMKLFSEMKNPSDDYAGSEEDSMIQDKDYEAYNIDFDNRPNSPAIKTIKAAIPYLEYKYQKSLGIMVKLMEIEEFLQDIQATELGHKACHGDWRKGMLSAVKPQLSKENRQMVDVLLKFIDLKEIMEVYGGRL